MSSEHGGMESDNSNFLPTDDLPHFSSLTSSQQRCSKYKHFKNPPQPHMCIQTKSKSEEDVFINVLSWIRIIEPKLRGDPIPLYGGMRVFSNNYKGKAIIFAVMANPEALKISGRHGNDDTERTAFVDLMCDFVEAMNTDIQLERNGIILKDRDISGELKDIWNVVHVQREKEREEMLLKQRNQKHVTAEKLFGKIETENNDTCESNTNDEHIITEKEKDDVNLKVTVEKVNVCVTKNEEISLQHTIETNNKKLPTSNEVSNENSNYTSNSTSKKDKLAAFLPSSCIFPKFKNKAKQKNIQTNEKVQYAEDTNYENNFINVDTNFGKIDLDQNNKASSAGVWC